MFKRTGFLALATIGALLAACSSAPISSVVPTGDQSPSPAASQPAPTVTTRPTATTEAPSASPSPGAPASTPSVPPTPEPTLAPTAAPSSPSTGGPQEEPTAFGIIDQALEHGNIDQETAVLYSVFAAFGDPRLPPEYAAPPPPFLDSPVDLTRVAAELGQFSATVREQIAPFLIAPMHAGSWWDLRHNQATAAAPDGHGHAAAEGAGVPGPILDGEWGSVLTDDGRVRIWYPLNDLSLSQLANSTKREIDAHIWPQLVALMGREPLPDAGSITPGRGGDDATDIVITPGSGLFVTVGQPPNYCERTPAMILADPAEATRLGVPWNSAIGHELMHAFQMALDLAGLAGGIEGCSTNEYAWWWEASATWVEDYLYPTADSEHTGPRGERQVRDFMMDVDAPLDSQGGGAVGGFVTTSGRAYGAYLWAFYAARTFGDDIIGRMWRNMESKGALEAIDSALPNGFEKAWPDFAVAMLNMAPFDFFRQQDHVEQNVLTFEQAGYIGGFRDDERVELGGSVGFTPIGISEGDFRVDWGGERHLAVNYNRYVFPDPEIRSVSFFNGMTYFKEPFQTQEGGTIWMAVPRPAEETRGMNVQALIRTADDTWLREDWTFYTHRQFCRDVAAERIQELIIITTNSVPERGYETHSPENFELGNRVWVSDVGCYRWEGSITQVEQSTGFHMELTVRDVAFERDPNQVGPFGGSWNINYIPVRGEMEWRVSGFQGECTLSGQGTAPIQKSHSLFTYNYWVDGTFHRGAQGTVSTSVIQEYRQDCPDFSEMVEFTPGISFPLSVEPDQLPLGFEFAGHSSFYPIEVTWNLQAVRE